MKALMKLFYLGILLFFAAVNLFAQSSTDLQFGGHTLGETAEIFFTTAKTMQSKELTREYCKSLLDDPQTRVQAQSAKDTLRSGSPLVLSKDNFYLLDIPGCQEVMAALNGQQANVGARLAYELGNGAVLFSSGKLSSFDLILDSSYSDTIAHMERRFGGPGRELTVHRVGWPVHHEMQWERDGVFASVWKNEPFTGLTLIVGYLRPPYDSFLRGNPVP